MTDKEIFREQIETALKAYQQGDVKGAYQLIKMHEDHLSPYQIQQKTYTIPPKQWKAIMVEWLNVAAQQMRIQLGLDREGVLIKSLVPVAFRTAINLLEDG